MRRFGEWGGRRPRLFGDEDGGIAEADRAGAGFEFFDKGAADVAADVGHDGGAERLIPAGEAVGGADAGSLAFPDVEDEEAALRIDAHHLGLTGGTGGCGGGLLDEAEDFVKLPDGGFDTKPCIRVGGDRLADVVGDGRDQASRCSFKVGDAAFEDLAVRGGLDKAVFATIQEIAAERFEPQANLGELA